ncbi:MAG: 4-hydroxy-tetrahydrodipicolinate reductase, partial [Candidatus Sulfotelmatobacter sp.]
MNILVLGRGKTGLLVAEVASQRKHHVEAAGTAENAGGAALAADKLRDVDVVIDFTAPHCVLSHIETCVKTGKNMVVGTTGWYAEKGRIKKLVETHATGFIYAANF